MMMSVDRIIIKPLPSDARRITLVFADPRTAWA
jgi:hypothetical protein